MLSEGLDFSSEQRDLALVDIVIPSGNGKYVENDVALGCLDRLSE